MAYHTTHIPAQGHVAGAGLWSVVRGFFLSLQKAFAMSHGMDQRIAAMQTLQAKSDADLEKILTA